MTRTLWLLIVAASGVYGWAARCAPEDAVRSAGVAYAVVCVGAWLVLAVHYGRQR